MTCHCARVSNQPCKQSDVVVAASDSIHGPLIPGRPPAQRLQLLSSVDKLTPFVFPFWCSVSGLTPHLGLRLGNC